MVPSAATSRKSTCMKAALRNRTGRYESMVANQPIEIKGHLSKRLEKRFYDCLIYYLAFEIN
jgi:hypothetical protein